PPVRPVGAATATVLVRNYAHVERRVVLEARVGTETWARRELVLAPRAAEPVLLTDPPADGELTVSLAVDDALAVDNRARAELPASRPLDVLVVSATRALGTALGASVAADLVGPLVSSDDVPFLLLLLSTLRWLEEPPGGAALLVETGVPVLAGPGAAEFHGPGLHVAGDPPVLLAERTGVYRVGARVVLANLFDDRESDIGREGGGEWPATVRPAAAGTAGTARRELG